MLPPQKSLIFCQRLVGRGVEESPSFMGVSLVGGARVIVAKLSHVMVGWYIIPTLLMNGKEPGRSAWAVLWDEGGGPRSLSVEPLEGLGAEVETVSADVLQRGLRALEQRVKMSAPVAPSQIDGDWTTHATRGSVSPMTFKWIKEAVGKGINARLGLRYVPPPPIH